MTQDARKNRQEKLANDKHINDLQFRLDIVASNAKPKGFKVQIGTTMPYAVVAKREARKQARLRRKQFGDFTSSITGKSLTYLKDGEYVNR